MNEKDISKFQHDLIETIKTVIYDELGKSGLLNGTFKFGRVEKVLSNTRLSVYEGGSRQTQVIHCNPDINFSIGDEVFIQYVNGNPRDKFIPYRKTSIETLVSNEFVLKLTGEIVTAIDGSNVTV